MRRNVLFSLFALFLLAGCSGPSGNVWKSNASAASGAASSGAAGIEGINAAGLPVPGGAVPDTGIPAGVQVKSKVALLVPVSGRGKETGEAMTNAALLAMNDLGASELFELMPVDTGTGAGNAAQQAIRDGAGLILGPLFSDDTKAVAPIAVQRGIPVVSFSTDTTAASGATFLMGFVPQTQVEQVIDYAASKGLRNIALVAPRDAYGDAVASTFYGRIGMRALTNGGLVRYDGSALPTPDQFAVLKQSGAQAVLIAAPGPVAAKISAAMISAGLPPQTVRRLGTGLWDDQSAWKQPDLQGGWYAAATPDMRVRFEQRYRQMYGSTPPRLASLSYDATALAIVLSRTGKGFGRAALTNPNGFSGVDGIFRFRPDGLADRGLGILEIRGQAPVVVQPALSSFAPSSGR